LYNDALRRRSESPQEAYATLKDIEQLLPNYPGLQTAIANLEIALGFRIPPPDPAKISQSRDLYLQARSIWDRNQRDLYDSALDVLNEAIQLNPDNRDAVALKDRLLVATGGERVDVLSSDDQRLLREAEAKYLAGDYFEALVIIELLLRKPSNQNNQEILDLEKRIRARTG
jgi:tetratricopeptide (TPR) repeat protein